jgi:hypothetical protein
MTENNMSDQAQESPIQPSSQHHVYSISEDPAIRDIFRFDRWDVQSGIDYLIGAFKFIPGDQSNGDQAITLDGKTYNTEGGNSIVDQLSNLHDRLFSIWKHSTKTRLRYSPGYFIRWGLSLSDIFHISWLDDARKKGLVPEEWLSPPTVQEGTSQEQKENLGKVKESLLKIIAGLYISRYSKCTDTIRQVTEAIEFAGLKIDERTVKSHLLDAISLSNTPVADKKLAHK